MVTKRPSRQAAGPSIDSPPRPRDRQASRERILAAVGRLLARDGFASLGVNAVAREAGVDKVLIYRYFGGMEALLEAWGRRCAFGSQSPASEGVAAGQNPAARAVAFLVRYIRDVRAHPEVLEVMRWELVEDNALTRRLADIREAEGLAELRGLGVGAELAERLDLPAMAAVLTAGLLHLALRARSAPAWLGVGLRTDEGWARIERAVGLLVKSVLS
ncbi:MAG TPA: TetR family transcriptional regulator [Thermoanaerobaculaceae bacterium]|nr:TetR family transcriptional regulator [Thermoanaerobaculaceae bacterium]HRS14759.1 TetR family transcriptional regulator [Thermoanaerobaculaceae bacterium]